MKEKDEDEENKIRKFAYKHSENKHSDNQAENREFKHWGHSNPLWIVGGAGQYKFKYLAWYKNTNFLRNWIKSPTQ